MSPIEAGDARELLEMMVTAVSVLGGSMAYYSGYSARAAMAEAQPPDVLGQRVNEGLGEGFSAGWPAAIMTLIIGMWT